ncbi:MAG: SusC/RagA family TonB-linked outer membrane protein, partial [Bacteroidota bacterium]
MFTFLLLSFATFAQQKVSGKVIDNDGIGIIGVNVLVEGAATGTVTDIDGSYEIMANPNDVIIFSFIGYKEQRVTVGTSSVIDLTMSEDNEILDEVVVTGYTVDRRRSTPGSVSTVKAEDLTVQPSGNVEQQLQGKVSGVTVITNGQPGTTSQVRVRGYGALGGNAPLYIIDGVPSTTTDFLNPDDIESVTVLKDATSASIYGARAAGGVIVYTTKKGKKERRPLTVTYNGVIGVTDPGQSPGILNPQDHADWTWRAISNAARQAGEDPAYSHEQFGSGQTPVLPDYLLVGGDRAVSGNVNLNDHVDAYNVDPDAGPVYQVVRAATGAGTDWYDEITRPAALHRHSLGFSGGSETSRFYVGLGMQEQQGILLHQDFSRYSLRINSEFDLLPSLRIGQNMQAYYRSADIFGSDGGSGSSDDENIILSASRMASIIPVYDEFGGYAGTSVGGFNNPRNPVATLDGQQNNRNFQTAIFGNIYAELEPIENLVLRTSFGGNYGSSHGWNYTRRQYENSENNSSFGFGQFSNFGRDWVWTNTANYKLEFGESNVDIIVGQEALNVGAGRGSNASGINPFSQSVDFVGISTVSDPVVNGGHGDGVNFSSYFARVNFDINDKYIVSFVVRRDGSSRFGSENRFGTFPAVSAAWRISSESFMAGNTIFEDLKLRAGYGIMGNSNNVDPNNQFSLFGTSLGASSYDIGGTNSGASQGFYRTRIGNPFAKWERAITSNIGLDAL